MNRPGKRERARVKSNRGVTTMYVGSAGTFTFKYGRRKAHRFYLLQEAIKRTINGGNPLNAKMLSFAKRLSYKAEEHPVCAGDLK